MKKIIILFLIISLLIFPSVLAVSDVNITFPAGDETLFGTKTILFTVSDSSKPQSQYDANFYYSYWAGSKETEIITDLNLFKYCIFAEGKLTSINSTMVGTGIDASNQWTTTYEGFNLAMVDGNLVALIVDATLGGAAIRWRGFWWNESDTTWWRSIGLETNLPDPQDVARGFTIFDYGTETYILHRDDNISSFIWNDSTDQWDVSPINFAEGLDVVPALFLQVNAIEYSGDFILFTDHNSFVWDGTQWNPYNYWFGDFESNLLANHPDSFGNAHTFFVDDGILRVISASTNAGGAFFSESTGNWVFDTSYTYDINLTIDNTVTHRLAGINTYNDDMQVLVWENTNFTYDGFDLKETGLLTHRPSLCSYPWDTTTVSNGIHWALDLTTFSSTESSFGSSNYFSILNWTDSDITCECISNCSSCILDVNAFVVIPTNQASDIKIKVENLTSIKNIGFRLNNNLNNDKQYFIHTSGNGINFSLNDTITYGSTTENGVQKIWKSQNNETSFFEHSFIDIIQLNEEKYYDLKFRSPMKSWVSMVNIPDWDVSFIPQQTDLNGHIVDQYQVSSYSNIRNELIEEIPNISGTLNSGNYIFQMNAKINTSTGTILAGEVNSKGTNPSTSSTISTKEIRHSFSSISKGILSVVSTETTSRLYTLSDYALIQRGFFTREFDVLDKHGDPLELYVDDLNVVRNYLIEGQQFKVRGQLYDRENSIDFMEIEVFLEVNNDSNKVLYKKIDIGEVTTGTEQFIDYDIDLEGIFDLTANTLIYRDLLVKIKVTDSDLNYSEVQHDWIKLRQFPFLPGDLFLGIDLINKLKSEHPAGRITLQTNSPEAIRGLNFRFLSDDVELPNSDFNMTLYKGIDFDCLGDDCSFDFEIDEWIFPHYGFWRFNVSVLLTTQDEDLNNSRTNKTLNFYVNFKEFKMAKIVETRERDNHDYKPTERIPLVMVLQDSDGADLKNQLNVYITVEDCNSATEEAGIENAFGCWAQSDINYSWKEHLYDELTGINYYFFESVMVKDFHTTFSDSNYMRVVGHVQDAKNQHIDSDFNPLLATKCKSNVNTNCHALDVICLVGSALTSVLEYGFGCSTENGKIITWDVNGSQEGRIDWDSTKSSGAPNTECFLCMNADNNNVYRNNLEQDLLCAGWYTIGEQNIDKLVFRLGNRSSDYSERNDDLKQYLEMTIPYSLIYYNDPILLKKGLELKFATGTCAEIGTLGELLWCGFNDLFTGVANPLTVPFEGITASGAITNIGFDCNFNNAFDPNFLDGAFFVKVDGLKVTNMVDYWDVDESIKGSDSSRFFKTLRDLGIEKKQETTRITFFGNDLAEFKTEEVQSNLVISELYSDIDIIEANIDPDSILPNYKTLPSILKFNILLDLVYNDETAFIRRAVPIFITTTITPQFGSVDAIKRGIAKGIDDFLENPADTLLMIPFNTILNLNWWAEGGWFWIFIIGFWVTLFILYRGSRSG